MEFLAKWNNISPNHRIFGTLKWPGSQHFPFPKEKLPSLGGYAEGAVDPCGKRDPYKLPISLGIRKWEWGPTGGPWGSHFLGGPKKNPTDSGGEILVFPIIYNFMAFEIFESKWNIRLMDLKETNIRHTRLQPT